MKNKTSINRKSNTGSVEHETKVHDREGDIMAIATKDVISIPPTKSIIDTAKIMRENKFRRLPIADPGSGKILGIVTVMDILDFLGGGSKYKIITQKYENNFLGAINEPIKSIMSRDVISVSNKSSIGQTIESMLDNRVGALPIVDSDDKLVGIVTERDIVLSMAGKITSASVQDYMSTKVFTTTPGTPIESVTKIMVRNGLRRIPIVGGEADISRAAKKILGIVTTTDLIKYINAKELFSNLNENSPEIAFNVPVSEIMVKDPVTIEQNLSIGDLCQVFADNNIGGVPVVKDNVVIGIITERDVLRAVKLYNH